MFQKILTDNVSEQMKDLNPHFWSPNESQVTQKETHTKSHHSETVENQILKKLKQKLSDGQVTFLKHKWQAEERWISDVLKETDC